MERSDGEALSTASLFATRSPVGGVKERVVVGEEGWMMGWMERDRIDSPGMKSHVFSGALGEY